MYAIIEDSGRQFKVAPGDKIYVDLRDLPEGQDTLEFDRVLAVGEGETARIGQPLVEGVKVIAKVGEVIKGEKLRIVKFKRRKRINKTTGHRQRHLQVTISEIVG